MNAHQQFKALIDMATSVGALNRSIYTSTEDYFEFVYESLPFKIVFKTDSYSRDSQPITKAQFYAAAFKWINSS